MHVDQAGNGVALVRRTPAVGHSPESLEGEKIASRCPSSTINDEAAVGLPRLQDAPRNPRPPRALHRPRDEMEFAPGARRGFFLVFLFLFLLFLFVSDHFALREPLASAPRSLPPPPPSPPPPPGGR